ncbi:MAG: right-handed parallel beta-helix repeat-containing protein [Paludibacter sp.]|nr:right-handed parallel beta-helix repeat-containing protein [Paludibacter sp.]
MKNSVLLTIIFLVSLFSFYSCNDSELTESYLITDTNVISVTSPKPSSNDTITTKDSITTNETPTTVVPPVAIDNPTVNPISSPYKISAPIVWNGENDKIISYLEISNQTGNSITLSNCSNITIKYCKLGPSKGEGVSLENCKNITIVNCTMESVRTGVYALSSNGVKVEYNDFLNIKGPMPRGQMVQFNNVSGADNSISFNVAENIAGQSATEDVISLYMSNGTELSPIKVAGNWIRGGGPSVSGGGIMTGDNGGSYVLVENNILVNPGQYGLSIAGGHHITIRNNKVYSKKFAFTNVGLVAWNQYSFASNSNTIMNNEINYTNKDGVINNMWNAGNMGTVTGWDTNVNSPNLNASILPTTIIGRAFKAAAETKAI